MIIIIAIVVICVFLTVQYGLFLPSVKGLPILMYHKVSSDIDTNSTISVKKLENQFIYLSKHGYTCIPLIKIFDKNKIKLPRRIFTLTFDDAYLNNLEYLYPLLQKYNFHATIMLPVGLLGKTNKWDNGDEPLMSYDQLLSLDSDYISFGLHTYMHTSLKKASVSDIAADIEKCKHDLSTNGIKYLPILAYPYGSYPRDRDNKKIFFKLLQNSGIEYGLRIGNRINRWPLKNRYEVKRISIRGDDSFWTFKTKLKKGRVKMF
jgi:peptidoglycan/xylan/chitin deacetylase (PgdA/CDA1 family)